MTQNRCEAILKTIEHAELQGDWASVRETPPMVVERLVFQLETAAHQSVGEQQLLNMPATQVTTAYLITIIIYVLLHLRRTSLQL